MSKTHLYYSVQPTRAARARWAFLEAGIEFEPHELDVFKGEHRSEAVRALNPLGKVPAARLGETPIFESSALAWIAASQQSDSNLLPEAGSAAWCEALQWMVFAPAELDHYLVSFNDQRLFLAPDQRNPERLAELKESLGTRLQTLADKLQDRAYLLGKHFSVADICIGHSVVWCQMHDQLKDYPPLAAYLTRLEQRPAFQTVYGKQVEVYPDPFEKG